MDVRFQLSPLIRVCVHGWLSSEKLATCSGCTLPLIHCTSPNVSAARKCHRKSQQKHNKNVNIFKGCKSCWKALEHKQASGHLLVFYSGKSKKYKLELDISNTLFDVLHSIKSLMKDYCNNSNLHDSGLLSRISNIEFNCPKKKEMFG